MTPRFENTYVRLPERFFVRTAANPVSAPHLIRLNENLAEELGLDIDWLRSDDGLAMLSGNAFPDQADPVAIAYAGHQFGSFVPQLGDGRALLLGEMIDRQGRRRDIQLKGSGKTYFSRRGDGRAALGPVLREYVLSEAMYALGVPTTRALAAVATGERVQREVGLPGGVVTRVAASHIRVGTFQYFAAREDEDALRALADHVIERHYPHLADHDERYAALLEAVIDAQAALVARWLCLGFIHGVMNTDNMAVSGETIDYGPCAFLDNYDPAKVFSSIDQHGRYAYANQPRIAQWNLARLAEAMLPLLDKDRDRGVEKAQALITGFRPRFDQAYLTGLKAKMGLETDQPDDPVLLQDLLDRMHQGEADFTLTFRALCKAADDQAADAEIGALFSDPTLYDDWAKRWRSRLALEPDHDAGRGTHMRAVNPAYIPRNHLIEALIKSAVEDGDYGPFNQMVDVMAHPFEEQAGRELYATPPLPEERVTKTFCGT